MHLGAHWGLWALAFVALIVGLFLILRSRRNKKWNWVAAGVLALVLSVGMFAKGWTVWPKQIAQHFISVVFQKQHDEAREMLSEPGQWQITDDGSVTILAEDSTTVTLSPDDLPLVVTSTDAGGVPAPMQTWSEFFAGRMDFELGSFTNKDVIVGCTAERGKVRIRHVEKQDRERNLPPDQFRVTVENTNTVGQSSITKRFVIEVGSPEGKRIGIGFGGSAERLSYDDAPQEPVTFVITAKLEAPEAGELQSVRVEWKEIRASSSRGSSPVIGSTQKETSISDVFAFQITSGLYKLEEPVVLATMTVDPSFPSLILHITEKPNEPKNEDAQ